MDYEIKQQDKFKFVEEGEGEPLLILYGLFGSLSDFNSVINHFKHNYKVIIPVLPLFDLDVVDTTIDNIEKYVEEFIALRDYTNIHLLGNSLGGQVALLYILKYPESIKSLILTGSSGLFEDSLGASYPKRRDYEFVKKRIKTTFYDPKFVTRELADEVFKTVNNRFKVIRMISLVKSALQNNLENELSQIKQPTCLIWGNNDVITPPLVGRDFNRLIPNSVLHFINKCGHAPMIEVPEEFNVVLEQFLTEMKSY